MKKFLKLLSLALLLGSALNLKSSERTTINLAFHISPLVDFYEISFTKPGTEIIKFISPESKTNRAILEEIAQSVELPVDNIRIAFGKREIELNNDRTFDSDELFKQAFGKKDHK